MGGPRFVSIIMNTFYLFIYFYLYLYVFLWLFLRGVGVSLMMQQALQNQLYGGQASAWNFGAAYRIPDTNINLSGTYQQGKANLQVTKIAGNYIQRWRRRLYNTNNGLGLGLVVNNFLEFSVPYVNTISISLCIYFAPATVNLICFEKSLHIGRVYFSGFWGSGGPLICLVCVCMCVPYNT